MRLTILILLVYGVLNYLYNSTLELYIDEAYYWLWSKSLELSYLDHPPMVAYIIRLFSIFGEDEASIRLSTIFCISIAALFIYLLAKEVYSQKVAFWAFFIFLFSPATTMGYTIITPDSPLIMFFSGSLYFSYLAIKTNSLKNYLLAGLFIGFALLSKYTAILIYGILFIFFIVKMPKRLLNLKPWLAILVSILVFLPVIIWNYNHNWLSFTFQYHHGSSSEFKILWNKFFEFFGGQFLVFGILFFAISLIAAIRFKEYYKDSSAFFIAVSFLFPLLFFLYKALFKKLELNWGIIAYVGGSIFVAAFLVRYNLKKLFLIGIISSILIGLVLKFPLFFGLKDRLNPQNRIFGYKDLAMYIKAIKKENEAIFADHLTTASILSYYLKERAYIPTKSRISQFSLWDKDMKYQGIQAIYVSKDEREEELKTIFSNVERLEKFRTIKDGFLTKEFYVYRVY